MTQQPPNIPYSIAMPAGAPTDILAVAMFLSRFRAAENIWVAGAANAVNFLLNAQGMPLVSAPLHDTSPGQAGTCAYDSTHFYVCVATDSWARVTIGGSW